MLRLNTNTPDIVEALASVYNGAPMSEFEEFKLLAAIKAATKVSPADGHMLSGMFYSIKQDKNQSLAFFHKSEMLSPGNSTIMFNFAASLQNLRMYNEAFDKYVAVHYIDRAATDALEKIAQLALHLGRLSDYQDVRASFLSANPNVDVSSISEVSSLDTLERNLKKVQVSESEYKSVVSKLTDVLDKKNIEIMMYRHSLKTLDGHPYLTLRVGVHSDASTIAAINDEVMNSIVEDEGLNCWNKLVVNVGYFSQAVR